MSAPSAALPMVVVEQVLGSINAITRELERLNRERATSTAALAQDWVGGHRYRYEAALQAVDHDARRLLEALLQVAALYQRVLTELADLAAGAVGAPTSSTVAVPPRRAVRRVAASPQTLVVLSHRLADQVDDYQRIGSRLRAECAPGDPAVPVLDECTRIAERLARAMADIAAFVAATARGLDAADHTLGGVVNRSGRTGNRVVLASGATGTTFAERRWQRTRRYPSANGESRDATAETHGGGGPLRPESQGVTFAARNRTVAVGTGRELAWGSPVANVSASYFLGGRATGEVSAGFHDAMATASIGGRVQLGLATGVAASLGTERFGARGSVDVFVGAMAEGKADVGIGRDGLSAEVGARVFVGGEISAGGQVTLGGATARGEAGVLYGAGFEVHGDVDVSLSEIGASLDIGAALGLGGHLAFDVTVKPKELVVDFVTGELATDAVNGSLRAASKGYDLAGDGFDLAGGVVGSGITTAGNAFGGGIKKLFG